MVLRELSLLSPLCVFASLILALSLISRDHFVPCCVRVRCVCGRSHSSVSFPPGPMVQLKHLGVLALTVLALTLSVIALATTSWLQDSPIHFGLFKFCADGERLGRARAMAAAARTPFVRTCSAGGRHEMRGHQGKETQRCG